MATDTSQILRRVIREELKPIREEFQKELRPIREDVGILKNDVKEIKKDVKELREDVDALRGDVFMLQDDVKGIRDEIGLWHGRDKREIDELKTHLGLPLMPDRPWELYYEEILRKDPSWLQDHIGKYVAIVGHQVIGEATESGDLSQNVRAIYGHGPIYMPEVTREYPRKPIRM